MKHRSATENHIGTGGMATFKDAAAAVGRAWRRKHGRVPVPALSHALSIFDGDTWTVLDAELGEVVAVVVDGMAVLVEDMPIQDKQVNEHDCYIGLHREENDNDD